MTFKKSYVPGILGSVRTLTVIMAAPVKAETKEETILNKTDWSTMAAANVEGYVNIRSEANADSEIVGVLMPGYAVTVTEKGDEPHFEHARFPGTSEILAVYTVRFNPLHVSEL